jgi:hypothetical protein
MVFGISFVPLTAKLLPKKITLHHVSFCLDPVNHIASLAQLER